MTTTKTTAAKRPAEVVREYGPFEGVTRIHGVTHDGDQVWAATGAALLSIDAASGRVLGSIPAPGGGGDSGLTWAEGSLWVGQYRDRRIHQIDPADGSVLERLEMPAGTGISGLESDGGDLFWCGGGGSGKLRAVRRPRKLAA
jgi:streptogramin lyase